MSEKTLPPVRVIEDSQNRKLGRVSATYMSQSTCPTSCPFFEKGCYANGGRMGIHTRRLNDSPITDIIQIAQMEADGIRKLSGYRPLRLSVVGDHKTNESASLVADAALEYTGKHGQPVYTYTHAWREVKRSSWGVINVLASCENVQDVRQAIDDGYAAAMVVTEFEKDTAYKIADDLTGIPCPEMTGKAETCEQCGLCMKADKLRAGRKVILFAAHGNRTKMVQNSLRVLAS